MAYVPIAALRNKSANPVPQIDTMGAAKRYGGGPGFQADGQGGAGVSPGVREGMGGRQAMHCNAPKQARTRETEQA